VNDDTGVSMLGIIATEVVLKWLMVAGLVLYVFFAIAVMKQVQIMAESVESELNKIIKVFAVAHCLMALLLVIVAIVYL
jgi:hypothetical protein